jgi:integrase
MSQTIILAPEPTPREAISEPSEQLQEERERAREVRKGLRAKSTLKAYDAAWRAFVAWCEDESRRLVALEVRPDDVCTYLTWLAEQRPTPVRLRRKGGLSRPETGRTMRLSMILRAYSAIAMTFRHAEVDGWGSSTSKRCPALVREQLAALRRQIGVAPVEQKHAITLDELRAMVHTFGDDLVGVRDKAILLLDFFGCNRRAETAAVEMGHVTFTPDGLTLRLPKSKTDQEGKGKDKGICLADREPEMCTVCAVREWIAQSGVTDGLLFRAVRCGADGQLHATRKRISGRMVARIVKASARAAGFDEAKVARLSSHSLRAGFLTLGIQLGMDPITLSQHSGHVNLNSMKDYIRHANALQRSPTKGMV